MNTVDILIEGVYPEEIPETFLIELLDFIEDQGFSVDGISIIRTEQWGDRV